MNHLSFPYSTLYLVTWCRSILLSLYCFGNFMLAQFELCDCFFDMIAVKCFSYNSDAIYFARRIDINIFCTLVHSDITHITQCRFCINTTMHVPEYFIKWAGNIYSITLVVYFVTLMKWEGTGIIIFCISIHFIVQHYGDATARNTGIFQSAWARVNVSFYYLMTTTICYAVSVNIMVVKKSSFPIQPSIRPTAAWCF
jgi:hypothetical protein